mmetsp:Transcript_75120/g.220144  ORF Transcript_75120/g.220144 Transcript_75120/m.220144 type:complete len:271 (+) Transcript_75120:1100-1912(+)
MAGAARLLNHELRAHLVRLPGPEVGRGGEQDNALEEPSGVWRDHVRNDVVSALALALQGDLLGVASEVADVVAHPLESQLLVAEAQVGSDVVALHPAVDAQAEVHADEDHGHVLLPGDDVSLPRVVLRIAMLVLAAVKEDDDGHTRDPAFGHPEGELQAVLRLEGVRAHAAADAAPIGLLELPSPVPGLLGLRSMEGLGLLCVWNAPEHVDAVRVNALDPAELGLDGRPRARRLHVGGHAQLRLAAPVHGHLHQGCGIGRALRGCTEDGG